MSSPADSAQTPRCIVCGQECRETIGAVPVCLACQPRARRYPLPGWLTAAALGLVALLALDLYWSARFWPPARGYLLAKRQAEAGHWGEAAEALGPVLAAAPASEPALLLAIKAELLRGRPAAADVWIRKFGDRKTDDPMVGEINAILERVERANQKMAAANAPENDDDEAKVLALVEEASATYPESEEIAVSRDALRASRVFEAGDYLGYAEVAKELRERAPGEPALTLMVASGLSAEYARSGDSARASEAREWIAKAREEAGAHADDYALQFERLEHRLATRVILTSAEYAARKAAGTLQ